MAVYWADTGAGYARGVAIMVGTPPGARATFALAIWYKNR
jgi:hypothetical protein